jgi:hypothetical protein
MRSSLVFAIALWFFFAGCATGPDNPSFPLTMAQARLEIAAMRKNPRPLPRPLVVIGGYEDPFFATDLAFPYYWAAMYEPKIIEVSLINCGSIEECRAHILAEVNAVCGNTDPNWTAEVDVVGVSLGGLAARFAAAPSRIPNAPQRLRIARLFTMSSPLAGAKAADLALTDFQRELRRDSPLFKYLAAADPDPKYEIYSYVHLGDEMVGQENAALPGRTPYWLPNIPFVLILPHPQIMLDDRVYADIIRRLRGETPYTLPTPAPFPKD